MSSRYLIGIDLGTTNSVVAYIDTGGSGPSPGVADAGSAIRVFEVPQLVAHGEVRTLPALPSFLYFPTEDELSSGAVSATWDEDPPMVTGLLAREQGALVPGRQVSSAKSWLTYAGVNRRARILPAQAEARQPMISPVDASARYLMHLRDAWNGAPGRDADSRFEQQEIVLTVPASFDEEARELTVEAARMAGFAKLTLLEEPLAAFYAWIAAKRQARAAKGEEPGDGEMILICDIGGGTSDFSLVRAAMVDGELQFERTAIGEHILLGGDNFDLALARRVEEKLKNSRLTLRQRYALRRSCCAAKERLLSDPSLQQAPITVLGSGHAVIGQALSVGLTRAEVLEILGSGFLPVTGPDEMPSRGRSSGLRELGLPYASDPAITRHLAAFLRQAAVAMNSPSANPPLARPDAVLFNGGFCSPDVTRERILEAISVWFGGERSGWRPKLLDNEGVDSAVARGAAYYGRVRRGSGLRVRVGSARSYYIGLPSEQAGPDSGVQGICVLPAGVEEGTALPPLNRDFSVLANRPVSFTLYSSRTRHDAQGEVAALDEAEIHRHAPLVSLLRYGKKMRELSLHVRLRASFTEVGTLELWCESRDTPHRWRLQFELRGEESQAQQTDTASPAGAARGSSAVAASDATAESGVRLIRDVFGGASKDEAVKENAAKAEGGEDDAAAPETLVNRMEAAVGMKRELWPAALLRRFGDVLLEVAAARKRSARHELRWLNLVGFCLRPGFGEPGDDVRMNRWWTIASNEPVFADDLQCQIEILVLLRRIAGGINASRQQALYREHSFGADKKKKVRRNRQYEYEEWRLVASLEQLPARYRASLGRELLGKLGKEPGDAIWLWPLGRLGARIPLYGPLHSVVTAEIAGEWMKAVLEMSPFTAAMAAAVASMGRRCGDSSRDIGDAVREQAIARLMALGNAEETVRLLSKYVPPEWADAVHSFGESLPHGLHLVSSSDCLLSVPAFLE